MRNTRLFFTRDVQSKQESYYGNISVETSQNHFCHFLRVRLRDINTLTCTGPTGRAVLACLHFYYKYSVNSKSVRHLKAKTLNVIII